VNPHVVSELPRPVDADLRAEVLALTRDLVRVDSSNPPGGETAVASVLRAHLEASGVACELVARDPRRANLVARVPGRGAGPRMAFVGHTDVVPAHDGPWTHEPFGATVDGAGYLWGRGAVDMKGQLAARAVAVATLARAGFRPPGDLLLIAEADEERRDAGVGMSWLVRERPDLRCEYALNEGGGERLELADGRVVVPLGIGEKAMQPVRLTVRRAAGHAALPRPGTNAVLALGTVISRLAARTTRPRLVPATAAMLDLLVPALRGDVDAGASAARRLHPALDDTLPAVLGTTISPTQLRGSASRNVLPAAAQVDCDCRLLPGDTLAGLLAEIADAVGPGVPYDAEPLAPLEGGTTSPADTPLADVCRRFLARHDPGATLMPKLHHGYTDSHPLRAAWGTVTYGFAPFRTTPVATYLGGVHAIDERVHVDDLLYMTRFHRFAAEEMHRLD